MKITSVNVRKIEKEGSRMKGIASAGGYRDIAHPINPEVRAMFEEAIIEAYNNAEDVNSEVNEDGE